MAVAFDVAPRETGRRIDLQMGRPKTKSQAAIARLGAASRAATSRNDSEATMYEEKYSCKF
jgi:hypothetical protein